MHADAIYYLRDKVRFSNPFMEETRADYFFSFVLVVWEPTRAASAPEWRPLELPRAEVRDAAQLLRVRRCAACGKYRVLPRHQQEVDGETFRCMEVADERFASCEAPCPVWLPAPN